MPTEHNSPVSRRKLGIFGVVAEVTSGASASAYLVAMVAMLFTASSYGRMAAAGLSPAQVLRSATIDAARGMKLDDVGALAPGRWADLVVLERNPPESIANTRSLVQVWLAGRPIAE